MSLRRAGRPKVSLNSWPLKETIAKEVTPALLDDIAAEHRRGRRLFVATFDLDAERPVIWNMGAIAAHGGEDGLALFRTVLLASTAVPGAFPPVLIDVEANGKRFAEMHVDGGIGGQFFVAPGPLLLPIGDFGSLPPNSTSSSTPGWNETSRSSTVFCQQS